MAKEILAREFAKKTFVQTGVKQVSVGWSAYFTIGNQSFTLIATESKKSAEMFERMVNIALRNLVKDYVNWRLGKPPLILEKQVEKYFKTRKRELL